MLIMVKKILESRYNSFSLRLETYRNYNGMQDSFLLSKYKYIHCNDNIIQCSSCEKKFLSWSSNEKFWIKHRETLCKFIDKKYTYWGDSANSQDVDEWLSKDYIRRLIYVYIDYIPDVRGTIEEFLRLKGNDANVFLFKEYLDYMKNFIKNQ